MITDIVHGECEANRSTGVAVYIAIARGLYLTRFNKIAIQGTPQMTVDKEARAYRESTHLVILSVSPYTKCNLPLPRYLSILFLNIIIITTSMYTISW